MKLKNNKILMDKVLLKNLTKKITNYLVCEAFINLRKNLLENDKRI
jgi:hypothetical protein